MPCYPGVLPALCAFATAVLFGGASALLGTCGPFTDVAADSFCPFVLEIFTLGITTGTTPTTYDPAGHVSRLQMAAFLSRGVDGVLRRGSRRAIAERFWTPQGEASLGVTTVGNLPLLPACDGADVWTPDSLSASVSRVRASDGRLLETWTGAVDASAVVVLPAGIAVCSQGSPAKLYKIDPAQPAGSVTTVVSNLGDTFASGIAFDGSRVWTANNNSLSIVTPTVSIPWTVTTVTAGFSVPNGVIFDGVNVWMTDFMAHVIRRLDAGGAVLQTITIAGTPQFPAFDGSNLWVPNRSTSVIVIRVSTGAVLTTLTGNGLDAAWAAAFDGERVLVTNFGGGTVSIWKAADLVPLGVVSTGEFTAPVGACSDGLSFWVTSGRKLLRI